MYIGIAEVLYFGFFCFEPKILPNAQLPPPTCDIPFTATTATYTCMILFVMIPLRIYISKKRTENPDLLAIKFAVIQVIHMILCLSWLIFALCELKDSSKTCWEPFTWQYLNYYLILILVLGPALTVGLGIALFIICLPCIFKQLITIFRDERQRADLGERVINGLAKRTFNP